MKNLPPVMLVKSWLSVINTDDVPLDIINTRIRLINKYFGGAELATLYIEQESIKQFH